MKKRSNKTYYSYVKRLLEGDSATIQAPIKADDPQLGQMILGASAGGVGAVACLKYLDNTFSISSLQTAVKSLTKYSEDIAKLAKKGKAGIWSRALGKLSSLVGTALKWVQTSCTSILKRFPSLHEPIFSGSSAMNIGNSAPTYGSVFCMALAAAAVGAVLYKIYKFIKGKRNKTESVAMYNFRKNYELSVMLDETTVFFNKLDKLIEATPQDEFRARLAAARAAAKTNTAAVTDFKPAMTQTKKMLAAKKAADQAVTKAQALDAARNNLATAGMVQKGLDPTAVATAKAQAIAATKYTTTPTVTGRISDFFHRAFGSQAKIDPNDLRFMKPEDMPTPELANELKQLQRMPEIVDTKYVQMSNGKVLAVGSDKFGNQITSDIITRSNVPNGATVVQSPKFAAAAQRAAVDAENNVFTGLRTSTPNAQIASTKYVQMSNGKVLAIGYSKTGDQVASNIISKGAVPKGQPIIPTARAAQAMQRMAADADANVFTGLKTTSPNVQIASTKYVQMSNGKVLAVGYSKTGDQVASNIISKGAVPKGQPIIPTARAADAIKRAAVDADANILAGKTTAVPKAQVAKMTSRTLKNGQELVTKFDKYGNEISSEVMSPAKAIGNSPSKAESFINGIREDVNKMWTTSKDWCKNNPRLVTMIAIIAALIACWFGVKKYRASKNKKQAGQQVAAAIA